VATAASPDTFTVGTQYSGGPLDRYFPGRIDQVKVYNAALDAAAIKSDLQTTVWVWAALVEAAMARPSGAPCGQPCATPSKGPTDISRTPTGPTSKKPGVGAYADLRDRRSCSPAKFSAAISERSKPSWLNGPHRRPRARRVKPGPGATGRPPMWRHTARNPPTHRWRGQPINSSLLDGLHRKPSNNRIDPDYGGEIPSFVNGRGSDDFPILAYIRSNYFILSSVRQTCALALRASQMSTRWSSSLANGAASDTLSHLIQNDTDAPEEGRPDYPSQTESVLSPWDPSRKYLRMWIALARSRLQLLLMLYQW
jgi:hypothetical protein